MRNLFFRLINLPTFEELFRKFALKSSILRNLILRIGSKNKIRKLSSFKVQNYLKKTMGKKTVLSPILHVI